MADALAVISVVASIVQLVDFGNRVLLRLNEFHTSAGEVPKTFQHIKAELPVLLDTLEQTKTGIQSGSVRDETKKALLPAINGCRAQIELLDTVIGKILPLSSDSWREKSRKAVSSLRQDAKVRKIRSDLQGYIQTLTFYHAAASSAVRPLIQNPSSPSSTVPFRRDRDFVDRDILSEIHQKCSQPASRVALVGLGGVGKSQLAIEYSYQVQEKSPDTWVFWVHASSGARFEEGYRKVAERVKIPGREKPEADILHLVSDWLCDVANGHWVMIVDNADDPNVFYYQGDGNADKGGSGGSGSSAPQTKSISDFLPQSPNGSTLITSRNRELAFKLTETASDIIQVDPMDQDHALALLQKKLGSSCNGDDAVKLLEMLDFMPLAITQAAAYINQRAPRITVSRYLEDLSRGDEEGVSLLKKDVGDSRRDGSSSNSIIATWQMSFEHIRQIKPSAARLLSLMSLFDRQGISESLLDHHYQEGDVKDDFEEDIHTLRSYSLIGTNIDGNVFEMHRLVQFATKAWLEMNDELEKWKEQYIEVLYEAFPVGRYENWKTCLDLFPHAESVLRYRPTNETRLNQWCSILFNAAWYADDRGNYKSAEEMNQRALKGLKKTIGSEHPSTLACMENLALAYRKQGRWKKAEKLEVQVMEISIRVLGEEDPSTLTSIANLASTYWEQGRWKEAAELQAKELQICSRVLGEEHPSTLTSMANLSLTLWNQGRRKEAAELQAKEFQICSRVLGEDHPLTLTSMANLASTYWDQGRWTEAEELQTKELQICSRVLGEDHPSTLTSMANFASTLWSRGRWKEAEELQEKELRICSRVLGQDHPSTLISMANLASTYRKQKRLQEAEDLQKQELEMCSRLLGQEHPDTLKSMQNLAYIFKDEDRHDEAIGLMDTCVQLRKKVLGVEHPHTVSSLELLDEWRVEQTSPRS
ncbi:TPR-like protein [Lophium mytilinum]|uniref:TPR-like protein n=1 Tax=Lophium mytilinum TaxID=390894 RepID=A0A6A6R7K7_9PEZI|nr:TPR-like protein [Lophium mytilinum]